MKTDQIAKYLNLVLLVAFPIAWFAPLLRTGLLPQWQMPDWLGGSTLFTADTLTVISGIRTLWATDVFLCLAVTFFALIAPIIKCVGLGLVQYNLISPRIRPFFAMLGKLAMADIFLIAIYIVIAKGIGIGQVEVAWGLYLFTICIIVSMLLSVLTRHKSRA